MKRSTLILNGVIVGWAALVLAAEAPTVSGPETWATSPHADQTSESFTHWNDEGTIPANCATCHASTGFLDYIGADGSAKGVTDHPAEIGTVVNCDTCHSDSVKEISSVTFPSGITIDKLDSSVPCMVCHQGRESSVSVSEAVAQIEDDTVSSELQFINIHYRAAAASLYGGEAKGGYEYPDKTYVGRFDHVEPFNTCSGCHDAHTTDVFTDSCAGCHQGKELNAIRTSPNDHDGDGDLAEGIQAEITTLHQALSTQIERYASTVIKSPVKYDEARYPYFFADTNADGTLSDDEAVFPNRYQQWTPRLLKAAYNYQFVAKDPGAYAHNPRYVLQLLYDSLDNLSQVLGDTMTTITRAQ